MRDMRFAIRDPGYKARIPNFKSHSSIVDYWFDSAYMAVLIYASQLVSLVCLVQPNKRDKLTLVQNNFLRIGSWTAVK